MPTVPYSGVPTVTQTPSSGVPYQNAAGATAEAFGANVGQAEQGLGRQIEQVGDMFAKHANVLQDRLNEADGNDLFVKWDIEKTQMLTQFQQLEGKQQQEAMPKFLADQEELRRKYLNNASNVEVKRIFDNNSKRQFGYMVGEAGRSAATQIRTYENRTAAAVVKNEVDNAPSIQNDDQLKDSLDRVRSTARSSVLNTHGGSEVEADNAALDATSLIIAEKTKSLAMSDPDQARQFYESHKDDVNGKTQLVIENNLQTADTNVGTKIIAHDIVNGKIEGIGPLTPDSGNDWLLKAQLEAKKIAAQDKYSKNPGFEMQLEGRISAEFNMVKKGQTELERGNLNTLREVINGSTQAPKITNEDMIHSNPALEAVWQQVSRDNPAAIPAMRSLIKKNTLDDVPLTQDRVNRFNTIMGMQQTDPAAFLMLVPKEKDLTFQQQNQIFNAQRKTTGEIESNSQFAKALSNKLVTEQLGSAQIFPKKDDQAKTDEYNQFVGAFKVELETAAANNNGKYPNADEQEKIAARLLRNEPRSGMFGAYGYGVFGSDEHAFKVPDKTETVKSPSGNDVLIESRADIVKNLTKRLNRQPTPQEVYTVYQRQKLNAVQ